MSIWLPPYRICFTGNEGNLEKISEMALERNEQWEVIRTKHLWESCLVAAQCGVQVVVLDDAFRADDLKLADFDEARFLLCKKLPVPFLLVRMFSDEIASQDDALSLSFSKRIRSSGTLGQIKNELVTLSSELTRVEGPWWRYAELQFNACIKQSKTDFVAETSIPDVPGHYLTHARVTALISQNKVTEAEELLQHTLDERPENAFLRALAAELYYLRSETQQARQSLDVLVDEDTSHPLFIYLGFKIALQCGDRVYACAALEALNQKFPDIYPTRLASGIWNCENDKMELGVCQLFWCVEHLPEDIVAGAALLRALKKCGAEGIHSAVKNHVSSHFLKTNHYRHVYSELL